MIVGEKFYISYTLGAKTDRYVRDMTAHMQELGMSHAAWVTFRERGD